MGSAAFLNEAVNQLADAYLERKQAELGGRIPHDDYPRELQEVRMVLADRSVFGVDLNPVAVERGVAVAQCHLWRVGRGEAPPPSPRSLVRLSVVRRQQPDLRPGAGL
jgi:hypothetical protein